MGRKLLLEFFISHFIKMSQKSNTFRNPGQATLYLLHAENLLKLLKEMGFEASEFSMDIRKLRDVKSETNIKDYWSISFGHKQLYARSHNSLPDVPSGHPSPIPGTEQDLGSPTAPDRQVMHNQTVNLTVVKEEQNGQDEEAGPKNLNSHKKKKKKKAATKKTTKDTCDKEETTSPQLNEAATRSSDDSEFSTRL